ncbi:hypothetical protein HYALB_00012593 [Hymenoscyphus albidus]|uniref:Uncharacterized protein n=1 Tax=Hymenoscyphus albidus TaxID=595503 RepID=A0A9N9LW05_9HELO|nr:hypothetical protein HYALB_00012593 [Hymenoscyphus albidus]
MRISFSILAIFVASALADGPCDVESDNCRAVINASACFNKYMAGGNKANILSCLKGTDGAATETQKMCACTGCVAPVMTAFISKNKICG